MNVVRTLRTSALAERSAAERTGETLRVCLVSADYPRESAAGAAIGGIGTHTYTLARAVADLGHRVVVLTESDAAFRRYRAGRVEVVALAPGSRRMWKLGRWVPVPWIRRSVAVWRTLRRLGREVGFDVVDFPDGYGEGFRYSYSPFAPFTVHPYGPASLLQRWDGRTIPPIRARLEEWMERRPASRAALVMCATRRFADAIGKAWSVDPARVRIIRNPIDLRLFHPDGHAGENGKPVVLFVGHLQRLKGVLTLAAAIPAVASAAPDAEFWLIGNDTRSAPDGTSMKQYLQRDLGQRGVLEKVRFFEPVHQRDLVAFYRRSALLVLPSVNDVYPNVVLEAMACGRPCVVTTSVGAAELIRPGDSGFVVPPEAPEELARALCLALGMSPSGREEMGARARRTVEGACSASAIAGQMVDAYRQAIQGWDVAGTPGSRGRR